MESLINNEQLLNQKLNNEKIELIQENAELSKRNIEIKHRAEKYAVELATYKSSETQERELSKVS